MEDPANEVGAERDPEEPWSRGRGFHRSERALIYRCEAGCLPVPAFVVRLTAGISEVERGAGLYTARSERT